ncbi:MAG: sugar phosphate isomerase/epimerase [Planctomycetes bacterium]|nr:sugar phosphate isomerase/epimerase [Planctomycetota bacterium]
MKLGVCPQPFYRLPLPAALDTIAELGLCGLELPVDARSPFVDLEGLLADGTAALEKLLAQRGLGLTALSIHQEGQLLLGPHHRDTDAVCAGTPAEKVAYAGRRLRLAADLAQRLGVTTVVGFVGCEDYTRFFPWPAADGWERMLPEFKERLLPILDHYADRGVRFAQEPHPKQIIYNIETAAECLELLGHHDAFGFNLDPANLVLAGVDPVVFAAELGDRIWHVHAKDAESVPHHIRRSGLLAHGPWQRRDRGFRFRVPGFGDLDWRRIVTELIMADYDGWLAIEHEDPTFGPRDGVDKAIATLRPLLPTELRTEPWW